MEDRGAGLCKRLQEEGAGVNGGGRGCERGCIAVGVGALRRVGVGGLLPAKGEGGEGVKCAHAEA